MGVDVLDGAAAIRRQRDPAVAHMQYAHRRAAKQAGEQVLCGRCRRSTGQRRIAQGDARLEQAERIDGDAAAQEIDQVERDFGFPDGQRLHRRKLGAVLHLELAAHRDVRQEAHAHGADEFDLASRPRRQLRGDPIPEARGVADQPGNEGDGENENREQAEEKPFPWQLARLHAVRSTRFLAAPKRGSATILMPPKTPGGFSPIGRR